MHIYLTLTVRLLYINRATTVYQRNNTLKAVIAARLSAASGAPIPRVIFRVDVAQKLAPISARPGMTK